MSNNDVDFSLQAFCKMALHGMKHPHASCTGFLLSPNNKQEAEATGMKIVDAIPVTHTSHYLAPNIEVAYNTVKAYADEQNMTVSGYYHIDKQQPDQANSPDVFAQKIGEKIGEQYAQPLICMLSFETLTLDSFQHVDGKWRKKPSDAVQIEENSKQIIYNKNEMLYRQIIDFDDHFDDISLDWTNREVGQKIDTLSASVC